MKRIISLNRRTPLLSTLLSALYVFIFWMSGTAVSGAADTGEVVVLFDQSGSIHQYDSKSLSKRWILSFVEMIGAPYEISLMGFDDRLYEHIKWPAKNKKSRQEMARSIDAMVAKGLLTDLEVPFEYLEKHQDRSAVKLVLVITDGQSDIWDRKLRFFSKKIKTDPRYEKLNRRYRTLKAKRASPDAMYKELRHFYHKKNLSLIKARASRIKPGMGKKVVIWDISGESKFLKTCAQRSGAHYLPLKIGDKETPPEEIRKIILQVLDKADIILNQTSRGDGHPPAGDGAPGPYMAGTQTTAKKSSRGEMAPKEKVSLPEKKRALSADGAPAMGMQAPAKKTPPGESLTKNNVGAPEKSVDPPATGDNLTVAGTPPVHLKGAGPPSVTSLVTEPHLENSSPEEENRDKAPNDSPTLILLLFWIIVAILTAIYALRSKSSKRHNLISESAKRVFQWKGKITPEKSSAPVIAGEVSGSMKDNTQTALDEAENLVQSFLDRSKTLHKVGKLADLSINMPPGVMEIYWTDKSGDEVGGACGKLSMHTVTFEARDFSGKKVDRIICHHKDLTFHINSSTILQDDGRRVVAGIDWFSNDFEDLLQWIELMESMDDGL